MIATDSEDDPFAVEESLEERGSGHIRHLVYTCPVDHVGTSVFVKGWLTDRNRGRPIILVHDLGETASVMGPLAKILVEAGHNVYSFDQRGHGQSGRRLGHIASVEQLVLDLLQVVAWVKHKEGGQKPILVGQGLGSLVTLFFAKGHGKFCCAMILASPMINLSEKIQPYRRFLIRSLSELVPSLMLPYWLCPAFTSSDPGEKRRGKSHPKINALLANELLMAISQAKKHFQHLNFPTLLICASGNLLYKYDPLKRTVSKQKQSDNIDFKFIDSPCHRLLSSEPAIIGQMANDIIAWLIKHHLSESRRPEPTPQPAPLADQELVDELASPPEATASKQGLEGNGTPLLSAL